MLVADPDLIVVRPVANSGLVAIYSAPGVAEPVAVPAVAVAGAYSVPAAERVVALAAGVAAPVYSVPVVAEPVAAPAVAQAYSVPAAEHVAVYFGLAAACSALAAGVAPVFSAALDSGPSVGAPRFVVHRQASLFPIPMPHRSQLKLCIR